MPFHLMKYPKGWKVMDDNGREYSKQPLTKSRANAQMRALYASYKKGHYLQGNGYTSVYYPRERKHELYMHGAGWFGNVITKIKSTAIKAYNKAKSAVQAIPGALSKPIPTALLTVASEALGTQVRNDYPPSVRKILADWGSGQVEECLIRRAPIYNMINKALNWITAGKLQEAKEKYSYDNLFHLSMIVAVVMPTGVEKRFLVEKNEVINITDKFKADGSEEYMRVPVPCCITFKQMMDKAQELAGEKFFRYDAFTNNCQIFLATILRANGLMTPQIQNFILQDVQSILKELPSHTSAFANLTTNIAAVADRVLQGQGRKKCCGMCSKPHKGDCSLNGGCGMCHDKSLNGSGIFDDIGRFFTHTLGGQQDELDLYNIEKEIGPLPRPENYGWDVNKIMQDECAKAKAYANNELMGAEKTAWEAQTKAIQDKYDCDLAKLNPQLKKDARYAKCFKGSGLLGAPNPPKSTITLADGTVMPANQMVIGFQRKKQVNCPPMTINRERELVDDWKKNTEGGQQFVRDIEEYQKAYDAYTRANQEIYKENEKIRDCNSSFGCSFKRGLSNVAGIASFLPGPLGAIGNAVSTGLDLVDAISGQGKGNKIVMTKKAYIAEHKRLIKLLDDIAKKAKNEADEQRGEPAMKGGNWTQWERLKNARGSLNDKEDDLISFFKANPRYGVKEADVRREIRRVDRGDPPYMFWGKFDRIIADHPELKGGIDPGYAAQKMANRAAYLKAKKIESDPAYQADLQKKREEWAKANPYECRYIYAPKEDIDKGDNPEEFNGLKISRTRTVRQSLPCEEYVKKKMNEYTRYQDSMKGPPSFWESFLQGFLGPIKIVADLVSVVPGMGTIGNVVSTGINMLGYGKPPQGRFAKQLKRLKISPEEYLKRAKAKAKKEGYDPRALEFSDDDDHKLMIYDDEGKVSRFGRAGYGDFIIYTLTQPEIAKQKQDRFHKSHSKIRGDWKNDRFSPNMLALKINW